MLLCLLTTTVIWVQIPAATGSHSQWFNEHAPVFHTSGPTARTRTDMACCESITVSRQNLINTRLKLSVAARWWKCWRGLFSLNQESTVFDTSSLNPFQIHFQNFLMLAQVASDWITNIHIICAMLSFPPHKSPSILVIIMYCFIVFLLLHQTSIFTMFVYSNVVLY